MKLVALGAAPSMSIVDSGSGIGVFLGLPALHALIEAAGWRGAYFVLGVLILVTVLPMNALFMRYAPPGFAEAVAAPHGSGKARRALPAGVFDLTGSYAAALVLIIAAVGGQYVSYRTALRRA